MPVERPTFGDKPDQIVEQGDPTPVAKTPIMPRPLPLSPWKGQFRGGSWTGIQQPDAWKLPGRGHR